MAELSGLGAGNGWPDGEVHAVQAAVEGVDLTGTVEMFGQKFRLGTKIGLMPLLKFANAAEKGLGAEDMAGMAAMYAMIRDCIDPGDWPRFEAAAIDGHADGEDLMKVVEQAMEQITARPTPPPSGSSQPGPPPSARSKVPSSSRELPEAFRKAQEAGDLIDIESLLRSPG